MGLKTWKAPNRVIYQYWAAFVANIPTLMVGLCIAWNGVFLADFITEKSPLRGKQLTESQMSWLPGTFALGGLLGTIPCIWIPERIGRQKTLFWIAFPEIIGWILPLFMEYYSTVVSRLLLGIVSGFNFVVTPTFVSEIADDKHRGTLGSFLSLFCNFGILMGFILAVAFRYNIYTYINLGMAIAYLAGISTVAESPTFYELKGDEVMKAKMMSMYRDTPPPTNTIATPSTPSVKHKLKLKDFWSTENRKSVVLALVLIVFPTVSGSGTIVNFSTIIFQEAGSEISPAFSSIIVASIQFAGSYIAMFLADRTGRKILLVTSFTGAALSLIVMGLYYFLLTTSLDVSKFAITPLISFSSMMLFSAIGLGGIPFVVIGEILPEKLRGPVFTMCLLVFTGIGTAATWLFLPLRTLLGMYGYLWMYATTSTIACIITIFFIPETKGKSIEVITRSLQSNQS